MEYVVNKELEEKETRAIFTDMLKYAPSKLCGMFGNVITVPIYTNLFSTEQYGLYSVSIAMLSFLCIIFSDWVGLSGLRFFRAHQLENDLPKYMTMIVSILTINMCLMFGLSFLLKDAMYSFFHVPLKYFMAVLLLIIPVAIRALLQQILRAQLKSVSYSFTTILNQFVTIGLTVFFAKFFNLGAASILLGMGVAISLIDVLLFVQCDIMKVFKFQKVEWKFILPIIKYGLPVMATALSAWIITQSNKIIMGGISGFTKAAFVGVGYGLTLPILMPLFAMLTVAVIPRVINMYEAKIDVRPIITKFMGYYMLLALPLVAIMSAYSMDYTVLLKTNEKFHEACTLVPYFSFGVFFLGLTDYTTLQYHLANKTHLEFIIKLISGIVGVILNIILIPKMGLVGVGIATFTANFLYFVLSAIVVLPDFHLNIPKNTLCRIGISAIPATVLYFLFKLGVISVHGSIQFFATIAIFYCFYGILKFFIYKTSD